MRGIKNCPTIIPSQKYRNTGIPRFFAMSLTADNFSKNSENSKTNKDIGKTYTLQTVTQPYLYAQTRLSRSVHFCQITLLTKYPYSVGNEHTDPEVFVRLASRWNSLLMMMMMTDIVLFLAFAICRRPSVCRLSSVTFVCPTQAIEIFGNISTICGTLAIHDLCIKFTEIVPGEPLRRGSKTQEG